MFDALKKKINAAKNVASNITDNVTNFKVSDEIRSQRLEICKSCDQFHSSEFCKLCGCYMPAKSHIAFSNCPLKKWVAVPINKE